MYICEICGTKFSSDFTDESETVLLIGLLADIWPLANGSRPICAAIVFGHADFADDADFSSWDYFVPQISQIYTDFFESQANRFVQSQGVSATTEQVASAKFRE